MPSPIENVLLKLIETKEYALQELQGHEQESVSIRTISGLTGIINNLSFIAGAKTTDNPQTTFAPVTNFFGEEIKTPKPIVSADLKPTEDEVQMFLGKVAALQSTIRKRQPETLIEEFSKEPLVLRKVAINAGLEDAREGIINIDFIERIKEGLTNKDLLAEQEDEINKKLAGEDKKPFQTANTTKTAKSKA